MKMLASWVVASFFFLEVLVAKTTIGEHFLSHFSLVGARRGQEAADLRAIGGGPQAMGSLRKVPKGLGAYVTITAADSPKDCSGDRTGTTAYKTNTCINLKGSGVRTSCSLDTGDIIYESWANGDCTGSPDRLETLRSGECGQCHADLSFLQEWTENRVYFVFNNLQSAVSNRLREAQVIEQRADWNLDTPREIMECHLIPGSDECVDMSLWQSYSYSARDLDGGTLTLFQLPNGHGNVKNIDFQEPIYTGMDGSFSAHRYLSEDSLQKYAS